MNLASCRNVHLAWRRPTGVEIVRREVAGLSPVETVPELLYCTRREGHAGNCELRSSRYLLTRSLVRATVAVVLIVAAIVVTSIVATPWTL